MLHMWTFLQTDETCCDKMWKYCGKLSEPAREFFPGKMSTEWPGGWQWAVTFYLPSQCFPFQPPPPPTPSLFFPRLLIGTSCMHIFYIGHTHTSPHILQPRPRHNFWKRTEKKCGRNIIYFVFVLKYVVSHWICKRKIWHKIMILNYLCILIGIFDSV